MTFDFAQSSESKKLELLGKRAVCRERIVDLVYKGEGENEKVFVSIERAVGMCRESQELKDPRVVEVRNLVFMKEKSEEEAKRDAGRPDRIVKRMDYLPFEVKICFTDFYSCSYTGYQSPNNANSSSALPVLGPNIQCPWYPSRSSILSRG